MKKLILFVLISFLHISVWAQGFHWGLNVAPGISYRIGQTHDITDYAQSVQIGEEAMYVFDFGMDMRKDITERLSIGTGIFYSQKGFSNTHVAAAYDDPHLSRRYILDFVQNYLEVPFYFTYSVFQNEQFEFYPMLGINNSMLLSEKNSITTTSGEMSEETMKTLSQPYLSSTKLHNLGVLGGVGIMGAVDSKTAIGLEAIGKVMLTPLEDQFTATQRHLYSFNLNFKFVRKIR